MLVTVGAVTAPIRWELRGALIVAGCVAAVLYLREGRRRGPPAELRVTRSGRVRYRESGGRTWSGHLGRVHWHSRRVAVLSVRLAWGAVSCLVLRYRQRPGEYRRLRVWLRHGLPEGDDGRAARGP